MKKEKVSREVKMEKIEQQWFYNRYGVEEKPIKTVKPVVLFDGTAAQHGWNRERFPGMIEE